MKSENYMKKIKIKVHGFTLIELMITMVITLIIALGAGAVMSDSQKAFNVTYDRAFTDITTDSYGIRRLFDATVRKSSTGAITVGEGGANVQIKYYNNDDSPNLDRYTYFYVSDDELMAEHGSINQDGEQTTNNNITVCKNVSSCVFKNNGASVSMILELDDGKKTNVVVTSAYPHN